MRLTLPVTGTRRAQLKKSAWSHKDLGARAECPIQRGSDVPRALRVVRSAPCSCSSRARPHAQWQAKPRHGSEARAWAVRELVDRTHARYVLRPLPIAGGGTRVEGAHIRP